MITCLILSWENILYKLDASPPPASCTLPFKKLILRKLTLVPAFDSFEKWLKSIEKKNFGAT